MIIVDVDQELERRKRMWSLLLERGGPRDVPAEMLRELSIYNSARGIWVDKSRTANISSDGNGVTVSLTYSGKSYPDEWSDDNVIYHYPDTMSQGRDANEIEATKNAKRIGLPVFVIIHISHSRRSVHVGNVMDWDDQAKQFLMIFDREHPTKIAITEKILEEIDEESPFGLFQREIDTKRTVTGRKNQQQFKFQVLKRYGPRCAVCGLQLLALLQASHIVPKEQHGSDDPRNGLILCANHHLAFDTNLFTIKPETLEICYQRTDFDANALRITYQNLYHIQKLPHKDAIKWRYDRWSQGK